MACHDDSTVIFGVASYGALGHVAPSTSNNLIFSVHLRPAQSLTATLCGCLSIHICILRQQLELCSLFYFVSFLYAKNNVHVVLCPLHQILATPLTIIILVYGRPM